MTRSGCGLRNMVGQGNDSSSCGGSGQVYCAATPVCGSGLSCTGGTCQEQTVATRCTDPYGDSTALDARSTPISLAVGDVDSDGRPNIVISAYYGGVVILRNAGADGFQPGPDFQVGEAAHAVVADFDEDGNSDVAVALPRAGVVEVLRGPGPVADGRKSFTVGTVPTWLASGDFNGHGHVDLAVANYASTTSPR